MVPPAGPPASLTSTTGSTSGAHLLVEYLGCTPALLDDAVGLERSLREAAEAIGARVVTAAFHRFAPHGVTGFLLLEESHLSIHTWPERGYAAVDLYSCGSTFPGRAIPLLEAALGAARVTQLRVARGELTAPVPLRVVS